MVTETMFNQTEQDNLKKRFSWWSAVYIKQEGLACGEPTRETYYWYAQEQDDLSKHCC